jgi:apolipoprotein N-acyltransferase
MDDLDGTTALADPSDARGEIGGASGPRAQPGWAASTGRLGSRPAVAARCVAAGLALAASVPPWGWWPLAFVGTALLDGLIADQPWRARLGRGWLVAMAWLYPTTLFVFDLTAPGYLAAAPVLGGFLAAAAAVTPGDGTRRLVLPGAVALAELVRWSWPFGGVPLAHLALSQASTPLGQTARLGGSLLVVALVVVTGQALAATATRRWRPALVGLAVVAAAMAVAAVHPRAAVRDTVEVALVQGGGAQRTRAASDQEPVVLGRHLEGSRDIAGPVDLIVWPENVVNPGLFLTYDDAYRQVSALADRTGAGVLAGWFYSVSDTQNVNYQSTITPAGDEIDRYEKVKLVPFGELVPFRGLIEWINDEIPSRNVRPGSTDPVLETPVGPVGASISWEGFFETRARASTRAGAELLTNPTNGASYWLTQVQTQQLASNQLRAIENDRWVLQVAPTGFSAVIDPDGTVEQRTGISERAALESTVEMRRGRTLATIVGFWPLGLYGLAVVGWALLRSRLRSSVARSRLRRPARGA